MVLKSLLEYVKNSKSPCSSQAKVCTEQPFAFMNKTLSKAKMHRTRFRSKYLTVI